MKFTTIANMHERGERASRLVHASLAFLDGMFHSRDTSPTRSSAHPIQHQSSLRGPGYGLAAGSVCLVDRQARQPVQRMVGWLETPLDFTVHLFDLQRNTGAWRVELRRTAPQRVEPEIVSPFSSLNDYESLLIFGVPEHFKVLGNNLAVAKSWSGCSMGRTIGYGLLLACVRN